jgi:hypothetical protein
LEVDTEGWPEGQGMAMGEEVMAMLVPLLVPILMTTSVLF